MIDMSGIISQLQAMPAKIELATLAYGETAAAKLQGEAQTNRPWTDRTAQAKQRLRGYVEQPNGPGSVKITLAHGVDYGTYLELAHEKQWAIVAPTLKANQQDVFNGWVRMVNKL